MNTTKIGIIGLGFVGHAINVSCEDWVQTVCVDTDARKGYTGTYDDLLKCDGIFICVPSPSLDNGSCDSSILESVLLKLKDYKGVIISKVTATPDVYQRLNNQYSNLVHSPEFLTASNAIADYQNAKFCIIGGAIKAYRYEAERIIKITQRNLEQVFHSPIGEAALAKYMINSFLATKVVFMNEFFQLAYKAKINYASVAEMISADTRIGKSHLKVPGSDGNFGFGGYCFPKDTSAILKFAEQLGTNLNTLDSAVKKNTILRLSEKNN